MPLRGQDNARRNPWTWVAILLLLAIAAIGVGGARNSGALAQPAALIKDLLKKKAAEKAKQVVPGKNQLTTIPGKGVLPGKGVIPGTKSAVPGAPKSAISTAPDGNVGTPKGAVSPGTSPKSVLGKGTDSKNATGPLPKGTDTKGTTTSALPKGTDTKGTATSALPKGTDIKGTNPKAALSKAGDPKGITTSALPKGVSPQGALRSSPHFAATAPQRMQLRADHRLAIVAAQRRLPPRPFPGERGFTGVPPIGETRFVSTEMMFRTGPNVSRQAVDNAARQLGLTVISAQDVGITGGTVYHFRLAGGRQVADVVRTLETQNIGIAQPNYTYRLFQEPELAAKSETAGSDQYVVGKLNLDEAHRIAKGANVLVAVIDSAIDVKHPDLAGAIIEQYDAVGRPEKPHPHGTGMTGAIAAHQKLMGIAPDAKILAVRAFTSGSAQSPEATTRNILAGIEWAIGKGARIINMSFAGCDEERARQGRGAHRSLGQPGPEIAAALSGRRSARHRGHRNRRERQAVRPGGPRPACCNRVTRRRRDGAGAGRYLSNDDRDLGRRGACERGRGLADRASSDGQCRNDPRSPDIERQAARPQGP